MIEEVEVYYIIVLLTSLAFILGYLIGRVGLSPSIGYLLAGIIAGLIVNIPYGLIEALKFISEISIVLLFFEIGYEVHVENLSSLRGFPFYISIIELILALSLMSAFSVFLGVGIREALVYGLIASFSSTVFTYKLLEERKATHEDIPKTVLMVAAVEDIIIVTVLALMSGVDGFHPLFVLEVAGLSLLLFIACYEFSKHVLPRIITPGEPGLVLLVTYGLFMGLVAGLLGLSPSLGAFIAGLTASSARGSEELMPLFKPVRSIFIMLFLVAMGLNVSAIITSGKVLVQALVLGVLAVLVHVFATVVASMIASGLGVEYGLETGFYLSTVSELSLVIAYVGYNVGLIGAEVLVVAAIAMSLGAIVASHLVYRKESYIVALTRILPSQLVSRIDYVSLSIRRLIESPRHEEVHRLLKVVTHSVGEAVVATLVVVFLLDYLPREHHVLGAIILFSVYAYLFYRLSVRAEKAAIRIIENVLGLSDRLTEEAVKDIVVSTIILLSWEVTGLVLLVRYGSRISSIIGLPQQYLWLIMLGLPPLIVAILLVVLLGRRRWRT